MATGSAVAHLQTYPPRMAKNVPRFHHGESAQAQSGVGESRLSTTARLVSSSSVVHRSGPLRMGASLSLDLIKTQGKK